jgi:hypothetical protein
LDQDGARGQSLLVPRNGAGLSLNPPGDCSLAKYSSSDVELDGLPLGTHVCIRTNKERYASVNAFDLGEEGGAVRMNFIVSPGSADK